jgi:hypothetical protein
MKSKFNISDIAQPMHFWGLGGGAASGGGGGVLNKVLDIVGSKGGQTLVNAAGAGLQAYGQHKQNEAQMAQNAHQFQANMAQRQLENDQQNQMNRAKLAADASPLGQDQSFAQKQAMLKAILPGLSNFSITPGDPRVAAAMGKSSGGFRLPEGGFDPAMIERMFGDAATMASLKQKATQVGQINPNTPTMDFGAMYGQPGLDLTSQITGINQMELQRQAEESKKQRELIQRAIDNDIKGEKQAKPSKAKSALGGALSGASTGASIGSIIPGIGTGIGAGIGAIGGFLKGLF